jgi:hypothetical protein
MGMIFLEITEAEAVQLAEEARKAKLNDIAAKIDDKIFFEKNRPRYSPEELERFNYLNCE